MNRGPHARTPVDTQAAATEGRGILLKGRDRVIPVLDVEEAIHALRDVRSVSIVPDDDGGILEVHVVSDSDRQPKRVARDVESLIVAKLGMAIDHRKISVAQVDGGDGEDQVAPAAVAEEGAEVVSEEAVVPDETPPPPELRHLAPLDLRIEFIGVSVAQAQDRAEARVELRLDGIETAAAAGGPDSAVSVQRLICEATLDAINQFIEEGGTFSVAGVEESRVGGVETILVNVCHLSDRHEIALIGACPVGGDLTRAVSLATLDAVNRFLRRHRFREPSEYELGPASED